MIGRALSCILVVAQPATAAAADQQLFGDYVRVSVIKPPRGGPTACTKLARAKPTTRISATEIADEADVFFSGPAAYSASVDGSTQITVTTKYNTTDTPLTIKRLAPDYGLISITSDMVPRHDAEEYGRRASFYCRTGGSR